MNNEMKPCWPCASPETCTENGICKGTDQEAITNHERIELEELRDGIERATDRITALETQHGVRNAALEDAAKVCEEAEANYGPFERKQTANYLALMIRALMSRE